MNTPAEPEPTYPGKKIDQTEEQDAVQKALAETIGKVEKTDPRTLHPRMMAESRSYAERFLSRSITSGKRFTVTLECVDDYESQRLFDAIDSLRPLTKEEEQAKVIRPPLLLCGCKVLSVYDLDVGSALMQLKQQLMELARS